MVEVVEVVVHSVLPDKPADAGADSGIHVEDGFVRWDELPFRPRRAPLTPREWVAQDCLPNEVEQVVLVVLVVVPLHGVGQLLVGCLPDGVWEVSGEVVFDDPAVAGEAATGIVDILYDLIDGGVRAEADSVVEGPVCHLFLQDRAESLVDVVVVGPGSRVAGDDLSRSRGFGYEGIGGRLEGPVIDALSELAEVPFPMDLELEGVRAQRGGFVGVHECLFSDHLICDKFASGAARLLL